MESQVNIIDGECLDKVVEYLSRYRIRYGTEAAMQDDIERILDGKLLCEREYRFDAINRIDFWIPGLDFGIECKVDGGPSAVLEQCLRYADLEVVRGLILVTSRHTHDFAEPTLRNKPFRVVWVGGGGL